MTTTRVLALALDACEKDIALALAAQGRMPVLASLLERGAWAPTQNPPGLFVGSVWPTIYTGVSPATHGRYCFSQLVPGSYAVHHTSVGTTVDARPFWAQLSEAGRRVAVLDVPHSFVVEGLNGIQLVDWGAHDANSGFATWPSSLADEVRSFGEHAVGIDCNGDRRTAEQFDILRRQLLEGIELRTSMAEHFLDQGPWDLFLYSFSEAHCVGHQCWHLHDTGHPRHDPALLPAAGDPLPEVYAALDAALGRIIDHAGPDTTTVVLLSHGMGAHYGGNILLDEILRRLDLRALGPAGRVRAKARELARRSAPTALRRRLHRFRTRQAERVASEANVVSPTVRRLPIDARTRRSFAVPNNDVYGAIRLNVRGREPLGTVDPSDVARVAEEITLELLALENDESPHRPVRRVLPTHEIYHGPHVDDLPDLLVEWNWDAPVASVSSPTIGTVAKDDPETRTGDHRPEGLIVAAGPGVVPGRLSGRVRSVDISATLAALCDVELSGVEGSRVTAIAGSAEVAT